MSEQAKVETGAGGAGTDAGKTLLETAGAAGGAASDKGAADASKGAEGGKAAADGGEKTHLQSDGGAAETPEAKAEREVSEKATADKSAADKAAGSPAPDYAKDLKRPDGIPWDEGAFAAVVPVLAQHKVSKEAAQALVDAFAGAQVKAQAEFAAGVVKAKQQAFEECKRTFRAEDFADARRAIDRGCKDENLRNFFLSELGNHPAFISMMAQFGRAIRDDATPGAAGAAAGGDGPNLAEKLYGRTTPK